MSIQQPSLREAIRHYDPSHNAEDLAEGERQRAEILHRFPLDAWPTMALEQYALGQPDFTNTYSRWLEFGSLHLGRLAGGNAGKHLIYRRKDQSSWVYPTRYNSVAEAWEAVRAGFVQMFDLAQKGEWDQIDDLKDLQGSGALRAKTLHIYFPNEILPITSRDHILYFLQLLSQQNEAIEYSDDMKQWDVVRLNRTLLTALRRIPSFQSWKTTELERFLYDWADPRQRMFKIAPGEQAKYWNDCLTNGYICVGWDGVGDLRNYESVEEFRESFRTAYGEFYKHHESTLSKKAKELWTLRDLERGDRIVANHGTSRVLAVGEVLEPGYEWRPERAEFKHTVRVRWDTSFAKDLDLPKRWAMVTVAPVSLELALQILMGDDDPPPPPSPQVEPLYKDIAEALERKGQVILYGPPGTGKTYHARRFAVWWLLHNQGNGTANAIFADRTAFSIAEQQLKTVQVTRRVWWMVANPREWSWDQLFQDQHVNYRYGRLQRNYPLVQPGDLVVGYQSTPDKRIVALARVTKGINDDQGGESAIQLAPLCRVRDGLTYAELQTDAVLKNSEPLRFHCQGTLFALTADEAEYLLAMLGERNPDLDQTLSTGGSIGPLTWITFHPSYSYEDFIEGFRPVDTGEGALVLRLEDGLFKQICREAQAQPKRKYLLIVDEINRANLAKVFGELITLLESDKRGMVVTLPQSKQSFTIPPNVYLLGTMNTADRSVKLMDTALRRRFAFLELMPDAEPLHGAAINSLALDDWLEELNRRIATTEGREKQIGHALLMEGDQPITSAEAFARRFRQDILPLLQEYCYDDYSQLAQYLGAELVDSTTNTLNHECLANAEQLVETLATTFHAVVQGS
jgi:5-methylcytosine-specific restriction enzyme B